MEDITFCKKNKINAELTFLRKGDIASYVSLDHEVLTQPEAALQSILEELQSPSPQPSPWKGEGDTILMLNLKELLTHYNLPWAKLND